MQLLYLYIIDFLNFKDIELNFGGPFQFNFNKETKELVATASKVPNEGFFGKNISNLTAIIGKNGVGKTNLLKAIAEVVNERKGGGPFDEFKNPISAIAVNLVKGGKDAKGIFEIRCHGDVSNIILPQIPDFEIIDVHAKRPVSPAYFVSNIFNINTVFHPPQNDLSTSSLIVEASRVSSKKLDQHVFKIEFKTQELQREIKFLKATNLKENFIPQKATVIIRGMQGSISKGTPNLDGIIQEYNQSSQDRNELIKQIGEALSKEIRKVQGGIYKNTSRSEEFLAKKRREYLGLFFLRSLLINFVSSQIGFSNLRLKKTIYSNLENTEKSAIELTTDLVRILVSKDISLKYIEIWEEFKQLIENCLPVEISDGLFALVEDIDFLEKIVKLESKFKSLIEKLSKDKISDSYPFEYASPFLSEWQGLSSGEEAKLSIFSRIFSIKDGLLPEKPLILLVDEGESFFHPEWQRVFFNDFINFLVKEFNEHPIQVIITSNSPFLISDIPKDNIIFLDKDKVTESPIVSDLSQHKETLGANIHLLLADTFFMSEGIMGKFAEKKINEVIAYLNDKESPITNDDEAQKVINLIGEPIIRNNLKKQLNAKRIAKDLENHGTQITDHEKRILELESELKKLKGQ